MELGGRPNSTDTESKDSTLLSASSIGSPTAFSTAIKPPVGRSSRPSADSSLISHEFTQNHNLSNDVAGRLSLGSVGSPGRRVPLSEGLTDGNMSLDDTSLGILDLEAMQDSSMTHFLTSPHTTGQPHPPGHSGAQSSLPPSGPSSEPSGFTLRLSSSSLGQSRAVGQATPLGAARGSETGTHLGARRRSPPADAQKLDSNPPDEGIEDSSDVLIEIPQELLERASVASGTECSSQSSYDEPLGELEVPTSQDGQEGRGGDFPLEVHPQEGSLPLTRPSGDGHETEMYPTSQAVSSPPLHQTEPLTFHTGAASVITQSISTVQSEYLEGLVPGHSNWSASSDQLVLHPSTDTFGTPQLNVDQFIQRLDQERETAVQDGLGEEEDNADATLIGDESEPTVMREADEFSQFEPTHLTSMLNRESFLQSIRRPVTTGQESSAQQTQPTTTTTTTSTVGVMSGSSSTLGPLHQQHRPLNATRFPATVDRHHVLHGDLKVSEQVRPVAEGYTEQDQFSVTEAKSAASQATSKSASRLLKSRGSQRMSGVETIISEGYFSAGQPSELDVSDLRMAERQRLDAGSGSDEEYATAHGNSATLADTMSASREGLPSAYLVPTSPPTASVDDPGSHSHSPYSPSPSSLASSLNELAGVLGTKDGEESFEVPDLETGARPSGSRVYNPFESDDNASVGSFGQVEFKEQSSDSFMAQLAKDEEEIEKDNLFADAPSPSTQGLSFDQNLAGANGSRFADSSGELSIGSYFNRRSHKLGALPASSSKLPPSERPQFSDVDSHIIQSPPDSEDPVSTQSRDPTASRLQPLASPSLQTGDLDVSATSEGEMDRTLVASSSGQGETGSPIRTSATAKGVLRSGTENANLTPVVTVHTPFPAQFQIPKLDLDNVSTCTSSGRPSFATMTVKEPQKESFTSKSGRSTVMVTSTATLPTSKNSGATPVTEPRPSSGMDSELPSQYWRSSSDTSTLVFPEISAMMFSPSPGELGSLDSIPTPSIARLSGGFNVTDSTVQDGSFPESLWSESGSNRTAEARQSQSRSFLRESVLAKSAPSRNANTSQGKPTSPAMHFPTSEASQSPPVSESLTSPRTPAVKEKDPTASPKTEAARRKLAELQATLDATRFNADRFLATLKSPSPPSSPHKRKGEAASKPEKQSTPVRSTSGSLPVSLEVNTRSSVASVASNTPPISTTLSASLPAYSERQKVSFVTSETTLSSSSRLPLASKFEEIDSTKPKKYVPLGVTVSELKSSTIITKKLEKKAESIRGQSVNEFLPETPLPRPPATGTSDQTEISTSSTLAASPGAVRSLTSRMQHSLNEERQTSTPKVEVTPPTLTVTEPRPSEEGGPKLLKSPAKAAKHDASATGTRESSPQKSMHRSSKIKRQSPVVTSSSGSTGVHRQVGSPSRTDQTVTSESTITSASETAIVPSRQHRIIKTKEEIHTHTTSPKSSPLKATISKASPLKASPPKASPPKASPPKASPPKTSPPKTSSPKTSSPKASSLKASPPNSRLPKASPPKASPPKKQAQVSRTAASQTSLKQASQFTGTRTTSETNFHTSPQHKTDSIQPSGMVDSLPPLATPQKDVSPPGRPIYTSPHVHPHTTSSPSKQKLAGTSVGHKAPPPSSLHVPDSLCFDTACCTGTLSFSHLSVGNSGERWLQLNFSINQIYRNGAECGSGEHRAFSLPQRCFVGPEKSEAIKVVFSPRLPGSYEAVLVVQAMLVVGGDQDSDSLSSSVILKALAEEPKLEISCGDRGSPELDYGVLVGGTSVSLPLQLANHGSVELPLRLNIAATTLSQLYFSFSKVPPSLLPSSPQLYSQPYTCRVVLPPRPADQAKPTAHLLQVHFKAPKKYTDDSSEPGPPDKISAHVDIAVDGANAEGNLLSVPLRAIVGVARLHVPRSLQALSLSCTAGQAVTREVPFKNAGNIPLRVKLRMSADSNCFSVSPDFLLMEPEQEIQVGVSFSPDSSPHTSEGYLTILVEPSGPNYEMKLRGTATSLEKQKDGLLSCSKRSLYWGGVKLNNSVQQTLVLHNSFNYKIPLQVSIRHSDFGFQLEGTGAQRMQEVDIFPREQLRVCVILTPTVEAVYQDALDIFDKTHSKKYRIPLCGYGGTSQVEVVNARRSPQGLWVDMGEVVVGQRSVVKVSLYNSGQRAAFAKALCYPIDDGSTPLPLTQASVSPSELIIQPQHMKELLLVYQSSEADGHQCSEFPSPLVELVLLTGDEIARQRFIRSRSSEKVTKLANPLNQVFLKQFPEQSSVPTELDINSFTVENEEEFFEHHVRKLSVSLSGTLPTETSAVHRVPHPLQPSSSQTTTSARLTRAQSGPSPPKALQTLSPSNTPHSGSHTHQTPTSQVVFSRILALPDTPVGHCAEQFLEIHNPFPHPLQWHLNSVAAPFVRDTVDESHDIYKATYSAFWVHERRGTVLPHAAAKVMVTFQPHDRGSFSQVWDLKISSESIETGTKKLRLSFAGKAVTTHANRTDNMRQQVTIQDMTSGTHSHEDITKSESHFQTDKTQSDLHSKVHPSSAISMATHSSTTATAVTHLGVSPTKVTPPRKAVYIRDDNVEFPATKVGKKSTVKLRVCNRDMARYQFEVIRPNTPFSVSHYHFELGARQCARLPVDFTPARPGDHKGILAVKTSAGHQAFAVLRAKSYL